MFNIAYKSTNVKSCTYKYLSARVDRPMPCDDMVFRDGTSLYNAVVGQICVGIT